MSQAARWVCRRSYYGIKLSMTCALYDRSQALIDGRVKARDIELEIHVNSDDRSRQRDAREGKFDIAEFFTGTYMAELEQQTLGVAAVPILIAGVDPMFGV